MLNLQVYETSFQEVERIMALYTYRYQLLMQWYWRKEQAQINHLNFQQENYKELISAIDYRPPKSARDFFSRERPPHIERLFDEASKVSIDIMSEAIKPITLWAKNQTGRKLILDQFKEKMVQRARYISMQFVMNITRSRRELYRMIFSKAFAEDLSIAELKALLRPSIVLTPRLAFSVKKKYQSMLADYGKDEALRAAFALSEKIKINRLNAIIRTETIKNFWHGNIQAVAAMVQQGLFQAAMKKWMMTGYDYNWENSMQNTGQIVGLFDMFRSGDYIEDKINGRCVCQFLFFPVQKERFKPKDATVIPKLKPLGAAFEDFFSFSDRYRQEVLIGAFS